MTSDVGFSPGRVFLLSAVAQEVSSFHNQTSSSFFVSPVGVYGGGIGYRGLMPNSPMDLHASKTEDSDPNVPPR
jgi:hypothetical protein